MTTETMSEEQMVFLVRNALLVAGQEMGRGDEWPIVKDTIHKIMKDWEDLKADRNVDDEMKIHLYAQIEKMEKSLDECEPDVRAQLEPRVKEWREICDAYFTDLNPAAVKYGEGELPPHIDRMNAILATLEDDHEE